MLGDTLTRPRIGSIIKYHNFHKGEMFFVFDIVEEEKQDTRIKAVWVSTGYVDEMLACTEPASCKRCWYSTWEYVS